MRYKSTRGGISGITFKGAVMMGLASDGGLLVPETLPNLVPLLARWEGLPYAELAFNIMSPFIDDIEAPALKDIINKSYAGFDAPLVTPLQQLGDIYLLELFHGPTLAFKDLALQFLGSVFEHILSEDSDVLNILVATSGDTGSAAIESIRGKKNINIYIMFPEGKTSPVQELQMTSIIDDRVHNIGIKGSFDDCQSLMKSAFSDLAFKEANNLAAVNSVNWTRVLAQIVYYFSAYYQLGCPQQFDVSVPTGNFGNIFSGFLAQKMGLPIRHLILATNSNDILSRFFNTGVYRRSEVQHTYSPAMDIQVSSNLERYLYYQCDECATQVVEYMTEFYTQGVFKMRSAARLNPGIKAASVSNATTLATIKRYFDTYDYFIDPHTAVGLAVAERFRDKTVPLVSLSTAHPAKFEDVMRRAAPGEPISHPSLEAIRGKPTRKVVLSADIHKIKALIGAKPR